MGTKRRHADLDQQTHTDDAETEPARKRFRSKGSKGGQYGQHGRRGNDGRNGNNYNANDGISRTKKRARTIARRLDRPEGLPANVKNELERELATHQATIDDHAAKRQRTKMIAKYHMVRFFERKKATRLARQLRKKLDAASDSDDVAQLRADLHVAEVDVTYTNYHPYLERYVSLYPAQKDSEKQGDQEQRKRDENSRREEEEVEVEEEGMDGSRGERAPSAKASLRSERPPLWKEVEKAMEEGQQTLERLRERRPRAGDGSGKSSSRAPGGAKSNNNKHGHAGCRDGHDERTEIGNGEEDDDDDDGFFE